MLLPSFVATMPSPHVLLIYFDSEEKSRTAHSSILKVTTDFATWRTRYVLVLNKFATVFFSLSH